MTMSNRSNTMASVLWRTGLLLALCLGLSMPASAIPAFARKYGLRCTACHESWPVLNDYGRNFRDNGFQLRLGLDDVVKSTTAYWPMAVHITPAYEFDSISNQTTDQGKTTLKTGGVA